MEHAGRSGRQVRRYTAQGRLADKQLVDQQGMTERQLGIAGSRAPLRSRHRGKTSRGPMS